MRRVPSKIRHSARARRTRLPGRNELINYLGQSQGELNEHDLARAFGVKGRDRLRLKRMLRDLGGNGRGPAGGRLSGAAASVAVLEVAALDRRGPGGPLPFAPSSRSIRFRRRRSRPLTPNARATACSSSSPPDCSR